MCNHQFTATTDEKELAECVQRITTRKLTGTFSRDAAIRMLKDSGFSYQQIREIWTIADHKGNGKLSNRELCVVVRLAGWVQQHGRAVSESLLATAGPLPMLRGVSYTPHKCQDRTHEHDTPHRFYKPHDTEAPAIEISVPQQTGVYHFNHLESRGRHQLGPNLIYPPITVAHMEKCRRMFERAGPIGGLMDRETAEEVLMRHLDAPFLLLKTILNLVRNSNRLSLNILEFTLAAYFVQGLQSRTIKTLPSEIPQGLYDQLWTPILLSDPPMSTATRVDERRFDSVVSAEQSRSPPTSARSSTSDLATTAALQLSPVRKDPRPICYDDCPSVSSIETRKISKLWKLVAKHCKIEKILKVSSTRYRKGNRGSLLSSDASIQGTISTDLLESLSEALERDTVSERVSIACDQPQPTSDQRCLTAPLPILSPVRKVPERVSSEECRSLSSVETRKAAKLWKRVAKHYNFEKVLKVPPTKSRENKRVSISSDVSIIGTVYAESSKCTEALIKNSDTYPTNRGRVSADIVHLPLTYPTQAGYYTSPGPVPPMEVPYSVAGDVYMPPANPVGRSSPVEDLDITATVNPSFLSHEYERYEASSVNEEEQLALGMDAANNEVFSLLKGMQEECTFLRLQMQIMQKKMRERPVSKNVHFGADNEADIRRCVRAWEASRQTQSLKISKEPAGPRVMSRESSISSLGLRGQVSEGCAHYRRHPSAQPAGERSKLVRAPRHRDGRRSMTSVYSFPTLVALPEGGGNNIKPLPRSILKANVDRPPTRDLMNTEERASVRDNSPSTTVTKHYGHKQATNRPGTTDDTFQACNEDSIIVGKTLISGESGSTAKKNRALPIPRALPSPWSLQKPGHLKLRDLPMAPVSAFSGGLPDDKISISSDAATDGTNPIAESICTGRPEEDWNTESSDDEPDESYDSVPRGLLSSPTESRRSSANTASEWAARKTSPTHWSSTGYSSIFSRHRQSARTTLLTENEDYNSPIGKESDKELGKYLLSAEEKATTGLTNMGLKDTKDYHAELLRLRAELLTKLERENEELRRMTKEEQVYNLGHLTADLFGHLPQYTPGYSQVVMELEEAVFRLREKEAEIRELRDMNVELTRRRMGLVEKLEQQNDELRRALAEKEEQILNPVQPTGDLSVKPPEYTLIWHRRQFM